ncbi:GAF domain-containing protein [Halobacillus sp. A1]|uniref:helix-turn-helix domain-containing protein n=1 Tax=Halobacillus sp. A1 TaxID=2880262 RepID=UPI0020A67DE3|nr:GAF domain-containing protein [Halobacillus sp. A1]MCP3031605.1 GAF domain-containing protein [Halobacillus sp. A1]
MKTELLNHLKERFHQENIYLIDKQARNAVSGRENFINVTSWIDMALESDQSIIRLSETMHGFQFDDIIVVLSGKEPYDLHEAYDYFKSYEPWLKLLIHYTQDQEKQNSLDLLMNVARTLASRMYEDNILELIIQSVVDAISAADTGFLFLLDEKLDRLLVKSAVGFREQSYKKTRLKVGEGISGRVFQQGKSIMIHGEKEIAANMENMSEANFRYYIDSTMYKDFPDSMISVPLRFQDEIVGVLTINSFKGGSFFTEEDLNLLESLADHVAIVITHAELYKQERRQKKELEKTHQALRSEHVTLQRTTDFHNQLTNIAARGEGADAIVRTLKAMVNHPFAIYDSLLKPFYIDDQGKNKQLPERFLSHERVKKVISTNKWQQITMEGQERLVILPVIGVESTWGFLCVWIDSVDFFENDIILFEYGATVLSLELTKQDAIHEAEKQAKGEFVEGLLTGEMTPELETQAMNLGFSPPDYYVMVLCKVDPAFAEKNKMTQNIRRQKDEIIEVLEHALSKHHIKGIVSMNSSYIFAMISLPEDEGKVAAREKVKPFVHHLEKTSAPIKIGIGRVHKYLSHLNHSYREAEKCIHLLETQQDKKVISYAESGIYRFFFQNSEEELFLYVADILGPLINYDRQKNTDFIDTLMAYITYDKNLRKVTEALNIHANTLYYRIKRMQEILDLDFEHSDDWLNVQLACQVYDYVNEKERE